MTKSGAGVKAPKFNQQRANDLTKVSSYGNREYVKILSKRVKCSSAVIRMLCEEMHKYRLRMYETEDFGHIDVVKHWAQLQQIVLKSFSAGKTPWSIICKLRYYIRVNELVAD